MPSTLTSYVAAPGITVDGSASPDVTDAVVGLVVDESVAGLARCELRLDNWGTTGRGLGYRFADRSTLAFGAVVEVALGPPDERATVFTGRISGLEAEAGIGAAPTLVVLAEDPLADLRTTRRTRTFEDASDADVVRRIASDHGLTPEVDLDGPTHAALSQLNQSDLAFLRDRVLPLAADLWLDGRTLHVGTRSGDAVVLRLGRELRSVRLLADLSQQATEQRVAGWDPGAKRAVLESADESALGSELGSDEGGGALLERAFGARRTTTTLAGAATSGEARATARGLYRDRARRFVTGSATAEGIAGLRAGRSVTLEGLGAMFDGTYRTTRVVQRYDRSSGHRTDLEVERPGVAA